MRLILKIILFPLLTLIISCSETGSKQNKPTGKKLYTCSMHPEIIRNEPGQCPICGMNLVEKVTNGEKASNKELEMLLEPTDKYVISKIATVSLREKELSVSKAVVGYVTYNSQEINTVSARISGRIENLYVKYKYQPISKGQKLMDIYSAELETEQENLLYLLRNDAENLTLIKAAEKKLQLLGLTIEQINHIKTSGKLLYLITVYSPYNGHLHDVSSSVENTGNNSMVAGNMPSSAQETQKLQIREGMYVYKGQTVFNIYSADRLWVILNIPADAMSFFKKKQKVKLQIEGIKDEEIIAKVDFIEPTIRENQKSVAARVNLTNIAKDIKIGAIVKAEAIDEKQKGLFVPFSSVVNLGLSNIVFLKQDGRFKAQKVIVGIRSEKWIEIISGISKEDVIALNAQMLMDSESFIKVEEPQNAKK